RRRSVGRERPRHGLRGHRGNRGSGSQPHPHLPGWDWRRSDSPLADYEELWDRYTAEFDFRPSTLELPGITEPAASVTWHLGALDGPDDNAVDRLQSIIQHGLRTCATVGEPLYWLDWQHVGYCFDPRRVGHAGQPPWPGGAFPDGDYYLYLTSDLRIGTFGHPWEHTLCVFGTEFLAQVEDDLTDLLGAAVRHGGHRIGDT
ncbi:MAG: hypothetical protein JWO67_5814, partial [Streptosporangiaceae bacterium]|nr:hypothetical protein [Streptosporangiaceae bacterium]